jgi:hypothetical protein
MSKPLVRGRAGALRKTDTVALQRGETSVTNAPQDCPYPLHDLQALVIDAFDRPVFDVVVELQDGNGMALRTKTGRDGVARFEGLLGERYSLSLCELERDAWAWQSDAALPARTGAVTNRHWARPAARAHEAAFLHTVLQGECLTQLAERFGRLPDAVLRHPDNAALVARRKDMTILAPGDVIAFPLRETKSLVVRTDRTHRLLRKEVQANLCMRFLDGYGRAHAGVRYLLEIDAPPAARQRGRQGVLDRDGFMREYILPAVSGVRVTLDGQFGLESYDIDVGSLDPIETGPGVAGRLNNLGLDCIAEDPDTMRAAIAAFQRLVALTATGELDDATRKALLAEHLS